MHKQLRRGKQHCTHVASTHGLLSLFCQRCPPSRKLTKVEFPQATDGYPPCLLSHEAHTCRGQTQRVSPGQRVTLAVTAARPPGPFWLPRCPGPRGASPTPAPSPGSPEDMPRSISNTWLWGHCPPDGGGGHKAARAVRAAPCPGLAMCWSSGALTRSWFWPKCHPARDFASH